MKRPRPEPPYWTWVRGDDLREALEQHGPLAVVDARPRVRYGHVQVDLLSGPPPGLVCQVCALGLVAREVGYARVALPAVEGAPRLMTMDRVGRGWVELDGVRHEVDQHLSEARWIEPDPSRCRGRGTTARYGTLLGCRWRPVPSRTSSARCGSRRRAARRQASRRGTASRAWRASARRLRCGSGGWRIARWSRDASRQLSSRPFSLSADWPPAW